MVGIMRQEQMGRAVLGEQALPVRVSHDAVVDAAENAGQGHAVLHALRERGPRIPVLVVVERKDVDRFPWEEVADDVIFPGAPEGEIRLRFALTRRRMGTGEETTIRLGPIGRASCRERVCSTV